MWSPMTTEQVKNLFKEDYIEMTCSILCERCKQPVFFTGMIWQEAIPFNFECPYCGSENNTL